MMVGHVRRNAVLRFLMHLFGAYLHFSNTAVARKNGSVQTLIAVGLGEGDVVFDLAWYWAPMAMDNAERRVAVSDGREDDTKG